MVILAVRLKKKKKKKERRRGWYAPLSGCEIIEENKAINDTFEGWINEVENFFTHNPKTLQIPADSYQNYEVFKKLVYCQD